MHTHFYGSKRYHAGRWFITRGTWRFSAPAYVSPRFSTYGAPRSHPPRVSMRGRMVTHSGGIR